MKPPLDPSQFLGLDTQTWLFTGAEAPAHHGVIAAVNDYLTSRANGPAGRERNARIESECKTRIARLINGDADQIALLSNASEAICQIALAIGWQAGDNVVIHNLEYPSGVLPLLTLRQQGVEVRVIEHQNWQVTPEQVLDKVDARTRLVLSSHVSYVSGARFDYQALYRALKNTPTLFLLDATQAMGVVPVDARHADFVVSSSYKWLLGFHGAGILALNEPRAAELLPRAVGWRSISDLFSPTRYETFTPHPDARRFELGYPSYATIYALHFSSELLLQTGIEKIEAHVLALGEKLIQGLQNLSCEVMTPRENSQRAGNIAFAHPRGEAIAEALRAQNVLLWGGDNRVRASIHAFNSDADIERALQVLATVLKDVK